MHTRPLLSLHFVIIFSWVVLLQQKDFVICVLRAIAGTTGGIDAARMSRLMCNRSVGSGGLYFTKVCQGMRMPLLQLKLY